MSLKLGLWSTGRKEGETMLMSVGKFKIHFVRTMTKFLVVRARYSSPRSKVQDDREVHKFR